MDNIQFYNGPPTRRPVRAAALTIALDQSPWSELDAVLADVEKEGWLGSPLKPLDNAHGLSLATTPQSRFVQGISPPNLGDKTPLTLIDSTLPCPRTSSPQRMQDQPPNYTLLRSSQTKRGFAPSATAHSEREIATEIGLSQLLERPTGTSNSSVVLADTPEGIPSSGTNIDRLDKAIENTIASTPNSSEHDSAESKSCSGEEDDAPRVPGRRYGLQTRVRRFASQHSSSEYGIRCSADAQHDPTEYNQGATTTRSSAARTTSPSPPLRTVHDTPPSIDNQPTWRVDCILESAKISGKTHFRVKWKDTWEPAEALQGTAEDAIQDFFTTPLRRRIGNDGTYKTASIKKQSKQLRQPTRRSSLVKEKRGRKRGAALNRRA